MTQEGIGTRRSVLGDHWGYGGVILRNYKLVVGPLSHDDPKVHGGGFLRVHLADFRLRSPRPAPWRVGVRAKVTEGRVEGDLSRWCYLFPYKILEFAPFRPSGKKPETDGWISDKSLTRSTRKWVVGGGSPHSEGTPYVLGRSRVCV